MRPGVPVAAGRGWWLDPCAGAATRQRPTAQRRPAPRRLGAWCGRAEVSVPADGFGRNV